jgi:hypothetical protein
MTTNPNAIPIDEIVSEIDLEQRAVVRILNDMKHQTEVRAGYAHYADRSTPATSGVFRGGDPIHIPPTEADQ